MSEHEGIWTEYRPTYWDGWSAIKRMGDLVRCRDCEMFETYALVGSELHICKRFGEYWHATDDDGFCAWGKRKESE